MSNRKGYKRPCYSHPLKEAIYAKYRTYDDVAFASGISRDTVLSIVGRKKWKGHPILRQEYVIDGIANALEISYQEAERLVYDGL